MMLVVNFNGLVIMPPIVLKKITVLSLWGSLIITFEGYMFY